MCKREEQLPGCKDLLPLFADARETRMGQMISQVIPQVACLTERSQVLTTNIMFVMLVAWPSVCIRSS